MLVSRKGKWCSIYCLCIIHLGRCMVKCVLVILDNDIPFAQQMIIMVGCDVRLLQMSSSHLLVSSSETLLPVIICCLEVQCRRLLFLHFVYSDNSETSRLVQGQTQIILKSFLCILFSSLFLYFLLSDISVMLQRKGLNFLIL